MREEQQQQRIVVDEHRHRHEASRCCYVVRSTGMRRAVVALYVAVVVGLTIAAVVVQQSQHEDVQHVARVASPQRQLAMLPSARSLGGTVRTAEYARLAVYGQWDRLLDGARVDLFVLSSSSASSWPATATMDVPLQRFDVALAPDRMEAWSLAAFPGSRLTLSFQSAADNMKSVQSDAVLYVVTEKELMASTFVPSKAWMKFRVSLNGGNAVVNIDYKMGFERTPRSFFFLLHSPDRHVSGTVAISATLRTYQLPNTPPQCSFTRNQSTCSTAFLAPDLTQTVLIVPSVDTPIARTVAYLISPRLNSWSVSYPDASLFFLRYQRFDFQVWVWIVIGFLYLPIVAACFYTLGKCVTVRFCRRRRRSSRHGCHDEGTVYEPLLRHDEEESGPPPYKR